MEPLQLGLNGVRDKYYINYIGFCLLGMAVASTGNFCLIANNFWSYKFRDIENNSTNQSDPTAYQIEFTTYFTIASTVPMFLMLFFNIYMLNRVETYKRFLPGIIIMIFIFCLILLFANINTDTWQDNFFILSTLLIFFMGCGGQLIAGATFETIGYFPSKYLTAVNIGESVSNIFAASIQIISLYIYNNVEASPIKAANIFFTVGTIFAIMSLVFYYLMLKSSFYMYYINRDELKEQIRRGVGGFLETKRFLDQYWSIFKKVSVPISTAFVCLTLTFALYPGITVLVNSEYAGQTWGKVYFKPTLHFLLTNIACIISKLLAQKIKKPFGYTSLVISFVRIILIPLLLVCNLQPPSSFGVWFHKDYQFAIILLLFMFSYGYIYNLANIEIMEVVEDHECTRALSFITIMVSISSQISWFINYLILAWLMKNGVQQ